jgi:uncharacterized membrane protein
MIGQGLVPCVDEATPRLMLAAFLALPAAQDAWISYTTDLTTNARRFVTGLSAGVGLGILL